MKIILVRHGKTAGNREKRYVGRTDECLCEDGKKELVPAKEYGTVKRVYVSPMKRCMQTADLLFPDGEKIVLRDFRECDFGTFEYKNYTEMQGDPLYQKWIDSNGELPFPDGESRASFQRRCVLAFHEMVEDAMQKGCEKIACVVHGGTIMSILDACLPGPGSYYDYQVKNGDGYVIETTPKKNTEHMIDFDFSICYSIKQGILVPYENSKRGTADDSVC